MQKTVMILSECEEINTLLYKPIIATQRIKYTCLNVSANYIVLGSTSGSLYLFTRDSCSFEQLIPLSEGPVSCVAISPDEKTIALATKRGTVCLVAVRPVKLLAVSSEHLGELITSLCWNDNSSEIYIGDGIGKISTMVLSIFTVNGMFQTPLCALMHLDSTIVQMQFSGHLLLVSTMTRCYICDTAQEQFKQIGNKARDGEFGACFLEKTIERDKSPLSSKMDDKVVSSRKGTFNLTSEANGDSKDDRGLKIYCARPGCRLWEVTANGIVVKTHQFKEAFAIPSTVVYKLNATKVTLNKQQQTEQISSTQTINFSHLYVLCKKYLFSYTSSGLYIIDPTNAAVILWNNEFANISMARTIGDKIYLITDSGIFHCLRLSTPESLILELYENKKYNECLRAGKTLRPELLKIIASKDSPQICFENSFGNDKNQSENNEITATLVPLISLIQTNINAQPVKLNSGIVVVNAGKNSRSDHIRSFESAIKNNSDTNNFQVSNVADENSLLITDVDPVIFDNVAKKRDKSQRIEGNGSSIDTENSTDLMSNLTLNDNRPEESGTQSFATEERKEESNEIDDITSKIQTDLNPVYILINRLKPSMLDSEIEDIINDIRNTIDNINENYGKIEQLKDFLYEVLRATERHYYNVFLENTTAELLQKTKSDKVINEIFRAFVDLNLSNFIECSCGYSYPKGHVTEPKFLEVGRELLKKLSNSNRESCINLCNSVIFMWREYLSLYIEKEKSDFQEILCLCLETRDNIVLSKILPLLDAKQWEIAVKCLTNIENGICQNCGRRDENPNVQKLQQIDWSGVAHETIKRDGPSAAMKFLLLLESYLPNFTLDKRIFQSLVFTKILDHHGLTHTVEFDRLRTNEYTGSMSSPKVQEQLVDSLEKDLERPIEQNVFGSGAHHWGIRFQSKSSTCPCCTLLLQTPVLLGNNGISLFPCGHAYHVNCLLQRKLSRCNLH